MPTKKEALFFVGMVVVLFILALLFQLSFCSSSQAKDPVDPAVVVAELKEQLLTVRTQKLVVELELIKFQFAAKKAELEKAQNELRIFRDSQPKEVSSENSE